MSLRVQRLVDANINRLREALRVCEDIARFVVSDRKATGEFKSLRHKASRISGTFSTGKKGNIKARNVEGDVGKKTHKFELKRRNLADVFLANMKRAQESVRVLEEVSKLLHPDLSGRLKAMRYKLYSLEKAIVEKL